MEAGGCDGTARYWPRPVDRPSQQIDHILTGGGISASDIVAPRSTASDHLPVAATLTLT